MILADSDGNRMMELELELEYFSLATSLVLPKELILC